MHPTLLDCLRDNDGLCDDRDERGQWIEALPVLPPPPAPEIPTHDGVYYDEQDPRFQFPY